MEWHKRNIGETGVSSKITKLDIGKILRSLNCERIKESSNLVWRPKKVTKNDLNYNPWILMEGKKNKNVLSYGRLFLFKDKWTIKICVGPVFKV